MTDRVKMTVSEVCKLIERCHESKVNKFAWDGLEFSFGPEEALTNKNQPATEDPVLAQANLRRMEFQLKRDKLEYLKLSDPAAYEELIQTEELVSDEG